MKNKQAYTNRKRVAIVSAILVAVVAFIIVYQFIKQKPQIIKGDILVPDKIFSQHTNELWTVRFNPGGSLVASADVGGAIKIWKKNDGTVVHNLNQTAGITSLAFSPDGQYLLTASYDEKIRLWNLFTEKVVKEFIGHKGTVWSVIFSPDGKTLASAGEDKTIKLWDLEKGNVIKTFEGHQLNIWKVRFSPDGNKIVSSSFDNTIMIWNVANGSLIKTLTGHTEAVVGLAISADGSTIASGSDDKLIKLWDANTGTLIKTLRGGEKHVYSVAFSPDSKRLVSGSRDKGSIGELLQNFFGDSKKNKGVSLRVWDVQTGKLLQTLSEHTNDVMDVTFNSTGNWLASASDDNTVRLWRVTK